MPSRQQAAVRPRPRLVDTAEQASLSFAPPDRPVGQGQPTDAPVEPSARGRASDTRSRSRRPRLIVEGERLPGVTAGFESTGGPLAGMAEYPVQVSKVQAPPLRDETLARDRLLDWLSVKIHRRVVLLTAEAGYGKTTLLADFTRRTRLRVLWFRLDRGDRDWVGFIAHLVAAVRIHAPDFGPATRALLSETATTSPSLDTVLEAFLRELAGVTPEPTAFVLDDFHLVDDSADVRHVIRELLTRGPERMSFVFASRREPPIRLARLRALGEVAELGTDDLRFDATETERLFRETYAMRLEPSLLVELRRRTEGWAASLQLVRAALHDRDPGQVRSFISSLSGAEGHLYEYLAEEVIGELPDDLQQFLMRTSILETVDLTLGPVAAGVSLDEATRLIDEGERHGLFGRRAHRARHVVRAHPLVRTFLQARLEAHVGRAGVMAIHLRVADAALSVDWIAATSHYLAAQQPESAATTLVGAIERILGSGAYAVAGDLVSRLDDQLLGPSGLVLRSRLAQQQASREEGLALAEQAWEADPSSTAALLNLVAARLLADDVAGAVEAVRLLEGVKSEVIEEVGRTFRLTIEASVDGSVQAALDAVERVAAKLRGTAEAHFLGIALLNAAYLAIAAGRPDRALEAANESISLLEETSKGVELVSARLARSGALSFIGRIDEARSELSYARESAAPGQLVEVAAEAALIEALLGDSSVGWAVVEGSRAELSADTDHGEQALYARALLSARDGLLEQAMSDADALRFGRLSSAMAFEAQRQLLRALVAAMANEANATLLAREGSDLAHRQGARLWEEYGLLLAVLEDPAADPSRAIIRAATDMPVVLSMLAERVIRRLGSLTRPAIERVLTEATRRPWRWRDSARLGIRAAGKHLEPMAELLEAVGESQDVQLLRQVGRDLRTTRLSHHAIALARRLAPRVLVEDLGRVRILIGDRIVNAADVRRRVLSLLCYLLSRPGFASTRDEVIDSLWPDSDPESALNSLNQTAYFLRRVFEPDYRDDMSPGYIGQDAEMIWVDRELVDCQSRRCLEIVRSIDADPDPQTSVTLATEYVGRYALDFAYEDWSQGYRESLHASYLRVMERAIRMDLDSAQLSRGTFLAERAAEVDPDAEEIQVALIRLYRLSGSYAAAGEKYAQYERTMKDLGAEPIPLADL